MEDVLRKAKLYSEQSHRRFARSIMFPAAKDEIVLQLRQQGAPDEVIEQAEKLPDREYENIGDIINEAAKQLA